MKCVITHNIFSAYFNIVNPHKQNLHVRKANTLILAYQLRQKPLASGTYKIKTIVKGYFCFFTNKRVSPAFSSNVIIQIWERFESDNIRVQVGSSKSMQNQKSDDVTEM